MCTKNLFNITLIRILFTTIIFYMKFYVDGIRIKTLICNIIIFLQKIIKFHIINIRRLKFLFFKFMGDNLINFYKN